MTCRVHSKSRPSKHCRLGRDDEHVLHLQLEQQLACAVSSCLGALQLQLPIHGHIPAQSFPAVRLQVCRLPLVLEMAYEALLPFCHISMANM